MELTLVSIVNYILTSLIAAITGWAIAYIKKQLNQAKADNDAVKLGIQALLRAQMISEWNRWSDKGYAPIYARENFENCYKQYETLGANGVINDLRKKFLELPLEKK